MKTIYKTLASLTFAGLLVFALGSDANAQRMRGGVGFRGGFGGGGGFRGGVAVRSSGFYGGMRFAPRVGIGVGLGYGYYRPWGYPSLGFRLGVLPYGYYPFMWGADPYFYYGGVFYQPYGNSGYQVVTPPLGAEVPELPSGAKSISIDGNQYYEFNGVYYKPVTTPDGKAAYMVAGRDGVLNTDQSVSPDNQDSTATAPDANVDQAPPMPQVGDMTDQLPEGSRKITLNGKKFFVTPDLIYLEEVKSNGKTSYRVVSVPEPDDQQQQAPAPQQTPTQGGTNL